MTKASDNAFPSILITEGTEPSAPAAGKQRLYIDSTTHLLKATDSSGTDRTIEGGGIGAWTTYTPTWTSTGGSTTLGNGTLTGRYKALDANTYLVNISLVWGSTTSSTGTAWNFLLPASKTSAAGYRQVLAAHILDSGSDNKVAVAKVDGGSTTINEITPEGGNVVNPTAPMTWTTNDSLSISGIIEVQ